jgi:glycosyltransferase involved in cell wall biosynthesis
MAAAVERARATTSHAVIWIPEMLPRDTTVTLYTHAAIFVCPSVYEPFGIINLEAMACRTPVVASAVGGIPEVVADGQTGLLVPVHPGASGVEPRDPEQFARDLAAAVNVLLDDDDLRERMSAQARLRVEAQFGWSAIARRTLEFYEALVARGPAAAVPPP